MGNLVRVKKFIDYNFFVNIFLNLFFVLLFAWAVYPRIWRYPQKCIPEKYHLTKEEKNVIPQSAYAFMAFFDAMANCANAFGAAGTPGNVMPIFNQIQLPMIVALTTIFLRKPFSCWQWAGTVLVGFGAFLSSRGSGAPYSPPYEVLDGANSTQIGFGALIYCFTPVFYACGFTYKDAKLHNKDNINVDMWLFNNYINMWQLLFTCFLFPIWSLVGDPVNIGVITGGMECALGLDSERFCLNLQLVHYTYTF